MKKYLLLFALIVMMFFTTCITVNATTIEKGLSTGWSYEESTSTLTLTNYTSTDVISVGAETCQIHSDGDLKIILVGTNTLNLESTYGIYVEGTLTIGGTGTINITNTTNGIYSTKNITIDSGTINAPSLQAGGGGVDINSGKIELTGDITANNGMITISNGEVNANRISAKDIVIEDGTIAAYIYGTNLVEINGGFIATTGIHIDYHKPLVINGGTVVSSAGIDCDGYCQVTGGSITTQEQFYVWGTLTITGGNINVKGGISGNITMSNGTVYVEGDIGSTSPSRISGGSLTIKGQLYSGWQEVSISGGTVTIESESYGIYAPDEDIIISGGEVFVTSQTQALKAGGDIKIGGVFETGKNAQRASYAEAYYSEKYIHISYSGNIDTTPKTFPAIITVNGQTTEADFNGNGWTYDAETSTLTLNDCNITTMTELDGNKYQIHSDGDLKIILVGTNTLNLESTYGIYVEGNLTIGGTGTINITNTTNGIYSTKNITIDSGTINAPSLQAGGGGVDINSGKIELTGDITANNGMITISNGEVNANRISAKDIVIEDGTIAAYIYGTNLVEINGGFIATTGIHIDYHKPLVINGGTVVSSAGIDCDGYCQVTGGSITTQEQFYVWGTLTITGGNINVKGGISGNITMSNGTVYVEGDIGSTSPSRISGGSLTIKGQLYSGWQEVSISGGTVTIESESYGIYAPDEDIIISGGEVFVTSQTQALKAGGDIRLSGNCISFLTGSNAANAKVATKYYGEKHVGTIETHSYSDATCISKSSCSICGKKRGELNADNHVNDTIIYVVNTSDSSFHDKKHKCCNALIETEPHDYDSGKTTTAATCKSTGVRTYTCTVCKDTYTETIAIDSANHTGGTEIRGAITEDCGNNGYTGDTYCLGCNAKIANGTVVLATGKHNHSSSVTLPATCKTTGVRTYICTVCEDTYTETIEIDTTNHTGGTEIRFAYAEDCGNNGYTGDTYCLGCNAKIANGSVIPATDRHNYTSSVTTPATCKTTGVRTYTCTVCGDSYEEDIPVNANNHAGGTEVRNKKEATCTSDGYSGDVYCTGCNKLVSEGKTINVLGHTEIVLTGKSVTCTETGITEGKKCSACGEILVAQKELPATGHTAGEWEVVVPAQVGIEGKEQQKCTVCGTVVNEREIPALEPQYILGDANRDGKITAADARIALRISAKLDKIEDFNLPLAALDVIGDKKLTAADARKILRISAKLE